MKSDVETGSQGAVEQTEASFPGCLVLPVRDFTVVEGQLAHLTKLQFRSSALGQLGFCKACNLLLLVQGISVDALSMLREAVNLTPDPKPSTSAHSQAAALLTPADGSDSDSEEQAPQPSAWARQSSCQQCVAGLGNCRVPQQGQEGDRGVVVLREAYRGMLLQQQARHRAELEKRQAKYQRQLDAQV